MKYSFIIATYNRLEELKELLESIDQLNFPRSGFQVLISDDGSNDGTEDFIESRSFNFNVKYIRQNNQGPGAARNHGMKRAEGEYFIFVDSDCILPPDYLSKVDNAVKIHHPDAFGGPDDYHPTFPPLLKAINYSMTSFIGTGGTRGSKSSVTKFYPRSFNMGVHRKLYDEIGGMGGLRHGQDMDFSARIYDAGYKVILISDAKVYHKRRTSLKRFYKQIFNWGVARVNLGRKHKNMLKPVHFFPAVVLVLTVTIMILSIFIEEIRWLLDVLLLFAVAVAALAFFQSFIKYREFKTALLSVVTLFLQVIAYGAGLLSGLWQWLTGKEEIKGFTKNYYK